MIQPYYCKEKLDTGHCQGLNGSTLKSDQHLISPYSNTAKPFIKMG